jgi:hypothetical protein
MSVYSVNVYPSSTTIKKGNWYYGAYAIVDASSNCNTDVTWYSNNTSVATVNASSGYEGDKGTVLLSPSCLLRENMMLLTVLSSQPIHLVSLFSIPMML